MQVRYSHTNGLYIEHSDSVLCEVFCLPDVESPDWLFNNGWLPTTNGEWYQSKSCRIKFDEITSLPAEIKLSTDGDWNGILQDAISSGVYSFLNADHIDFCIQTAKRIVYLNDVVFAVLNVLDGQPYISTVIGTRSAKNLLQYIIPYFINVCISDSEIQYTSDYLFLGEWYGQHTYKQLYGRFEWWDGAKWNS